MTLGAALGVILGATVLAGLSAAVARAQDLQFRHLGNEDGLPSSWVTHVVEDRRGFLWVGTARGVSRYDGHRFRTYGPERGNPYALPAGRVDQVYEDRAGTLWAVTTAGLSRYDGAHDGWLTYPAARFRAALPAGAGPTTPTVLAVAEDARGAFWVGTSAGLVRFDRRSGQVTPVPLAGGGAAEPYVMALHVDRGGRLWVGTRVGVYLLAATTRAVRHLAHVPADPHSLPDSVVRAIAEDGAGTVWVGTDHGGLARWDEALAGAGPGRTGGFVSYRHDPADTTSLARDRVTRLAADRVRGGLWVGTENAGLDYLAPGARRFVHHRYSPDAAAGLGGNSIWALYQDTAGALWVGTYSGGLDVSTPNGAAIRRYGTVAGDTASLSYNAVPGFGEGRDGAVWVATDGGGLNRFDPRTGRFTRYTTATTNLRSDAVVAVHETRRGEVWVADWGAGIARFDRERRRFTHYDRATAGAPDDNVHTLLEDRAGRLWVGTYNGVVALFDAARGRFTRRYPLRRPARDGGASALVLRELHDGTLAVGLREGGVALVDPATGAQRYVTAEDPVHPLANDNVRALLEGDPAREPGVLWIGSEGGLDRLDRRTGAVTHYGTADGLPSELVFGLLPDADGRLWVSTDRGVTRWDPRRRTGVTYARADGLPRGEFLVGSALRARDGTLYFGGNDGFATVRPDRIVENRRPPRVALTGLQLFNAPVAVGAPGSPLRRPIHETAEVALAYDQRAVTIEYAALDYAAPEKNRYAYRLDGVDAGWQQAGGRPAASYTNLAPGTYTFRVRASNADGVWNVEGAAVRLVVRPPWWQTWWFRLLAAGAALVAAWRFVRFRERRRVEVALSRQALHDPLTGLANRALFRDRVGHALARRARAGQAAAGEPARVAVLYLDLDGFKPVNDTLGHAAGDQLLQAVAARLLSATRGSDTVARLGGDEFAILIENARGPGDATTLAERVVAGLRAPIAVTDGKEARVGVSVGVAFADPGMDVDALLRHADAAMYAAKRAGKGQHLVYDPAASAGADLLAATAPASSSP